MRKRRMSFRRWCRLDENDERRINYTVNFNGKTYNFTSDQTSREANLPFGIGWLAECAMIDAVEMRNDEWYITLSDRRCNMKYLYTVSRAKQELNGLLTQASDGKTVGHAYKKAMIRLRNWIINGDVNPKYQYDLEVFLELEARTRAEMRGENW